MGSGHVARGADLPARIMVVGGAGCVVLGGLVAAATGPLGLGDGSWLAAYLVLVCGVGTYAIGAVQARSEAPLPVTRGRVQLGCWSLGNAAVITGSLTADAVVVDAGVPLMVVALAIALAHTVRSAGLSARGAASRPATWAYRCLLVVLMISTPVGAVLAHLR